MSEILAFYMKPFTHEKGEPLDGVGLDLGPQIKLGEGDKIMPLGSWLEEQEGFLAFRCDDQLQSNYEAKEPPCLENLGHV